MAAIKVSYNGSNTHDVSDVRTYKIGPDRIQAVGIVDGRVLSIKYTASAYSKYGIKTGKPFLRQIRQDLVHKYVDTYGDNGKITPTIKVDSEFLDLLKAEGFDVIAGVVGLPYGVNVCITDMTQIDAINAIKRGIVKSEALKAKAEAEERAEIKRLFEQLIKDSKMA